MSSLFERSLTNPPDLFREICVVLFAGGGGSSLAYEMATGQPVDVAVNHDASAVAMHQANHPLTEHYKADVFEVSPREASGGRPVGLLWASPDCTFFSKARGGKPIRDNLRRRRSLAWVVKWWAATVKPRVIMMENVEEIVKWGPLRGKDGNLRPHKGRAGRTFKKFVRSLRQEGYKVEWRELRACDYGAPTIRKRWFCIARCDGEQIVWPEPTHGDPKSAAVRSGALKPWRTAAECIDWSLPMCSVFATKDEAKAWAKEHGKQCPIRPLADNTFGRLARGLKIHVLESASPFFVPITHQGSRRCPATHEPFPTITSAHRGEIAVASPIIANVANSKTTGRDPNHWSVSDPLRTVTTSNGFAVASASYTAGCGGRAGQSPERSLEEPFATITAKADTVIASPCFVHTAHSEGGARSKRWGHGSKEVARPLASVTGSNDLALSMSWFIPRYGERPGQAMRTRSIGDPYPAVVCDGNGGGLASAFLSQYYGGAPRSCEIGEPLRTQSTENRFALTAMSLDLYYGTPQAARIDRPLPTVTTRDHASVVASFLATNVGGYAIDNSGNGKHLGAPVSTITGKGANHSVVGVWLDHAFGGFYSAKGRSLRDPLGTILTESRGHQGALAHDPSSTLTTGSQQMLAGVYFHHNNTGWNPCSSGKDPLHTIVADGARHNVTCAFMQRDFGNSVGASLQLPSPTITGTGNGKAALVAALLEKWFPGSTKGQFVEKWIGWTRYVVSDIRMRMLTPRELFRCQGFPDTYVIDRGADGRKLTATEQVHMCGNSVSPWPARAMIRANCAHMMARPSEAIYDALAKAFGLDAEAVAA